LQAGAARVVRERDSERSAQAVATIVDLARETIEEIDRIVGLLREDAEMGRSPLPGIDQIPALVERQRAGGLDVHLTIDGEPDRRPPTPVSRAAYRIAQESLTNVLRHASASEARVSVARDAGGVRVEVTDDGLGSRGAGGTGSGLRGMRERVAALDGELESGPADGGGWRVTARLPMGAAT
jgi:signal transduction histidine kinase